MGSLFCSIDLCVCFVPVLYCPDKYSFVIQLEVWDCNATRLLVFFFNIPLALLGLLWFHTNFRIICSSSLKNVYGILIGIALNVEIVLGNIYILTMFVLLIHEHRKIFHFFVSSSISFINVL